MCDSISMPGAFCPVFSFSGCNSCLPPDLPSRLLQARVALLVRPPRAKAQSNDGRPRSPLEQQDGENDTETEAEGGFYHEVGEAPVPLCITLRQCQFLCSQIHDLNRPAVLTCEPDGVWEYNRTFSFRRASLTGRETVLGGGGGTEVSAMVIYRRRTRCVSRRVSCQLNQGYIGNDHTYLSQG